MGSGDHPDPLIRIPTGSPGAWAIINWPLEGYRALFLRIHIEHRIQILKVGVRSAANSRYFFMFPDNFEG